MVISSEAPGVEIAVTVGGNDLKEYEDDEAEPEFESSSGDVETTVRYIEATSNQTFAIRVRVDKDFDFAANALIFYVSMDGASVASHAVVKQANQRDDYSVISEGCKGGDGRLRKYQFTVLETGKFYVNTGSSSQAYEDISERQPSATEGGKEPQRSGNDRGEGRAEE